MTAEEKTTLLSILCDADKEAGWMSDDMGRMGILFRSDGTGLLRCSVELARLVIADFTWKAHDPNHLHQILDIHRNETDPNKKFTVDQFVIDINLISNRVAKNALDMINEDAFKPKTFTIRLEEGAFVAQDNKINSKEYCRHKYARRLVFDSPPLPKGVWTVKGRNNARSCRFWEHTEFVARPLPREEGIWIGLKETGWFYGNVIRGLF